MQSMEQMESMGTLGTSPERSNRRQTMRSLLVMSPPRRRLAPTGDVADELGIDRSTLVRWWQRGIVTPAFVTVGKHARWDLDDLRSQIQAWRDSADYNPDDDEAPGQ
jgi:hypothetical protein